MTLSREYDLYGYKFKGNVFATYADMRAAVRFAAEDVEIAGQTIRKGDPVWVVLAASNRDPSKFGCPDEVDLDRADARHLAFGQGIHFCLGAPLARLEGEIALSTVVRRLPNLRLNAPVERLRWRMTPIVFGLESLPVAWD
jgi:cytochrome P450